MKLSKTLEFLIGFIVVLITAAVVAPWIANLVPYEFSRVLSRTVMVLFLIWVGIFLWRQGGISVTRYGLIWNHSTRYHVWIGFVISVLALTAMVLVELPFGVRSWQFTFNQTVWPVKLLKYLISGLVVGLIEEFVFRGVLFKSLAKRLRLWAALVGTNLIYSAVHFLRFSGEEISEPTLSSSFQVYLAIFEPFSRLGEIWPNAIGLFLFGMVLSYTFIRSGSLLFPIGIHAGGVFFLKMDQWFIQLNSEEHKIWFGGSDLQACVLGWMMILGIAFLSSLVLKKTDFRR